MKPLSDLLKGSLISIVIALGAAQTAQAKPLQIPLGIAYGVEPNVMILLDTSGSMSRDENRINVDGVLKTRLLVAKEAVTKVISDTENMRFCLSIFEQNTTSYYGTPHSPGALIDANMLCSSDPAKIQTLINRINSIPDLNTNNGSTPLAESYYDITRYFRGQEAYFGNFQAFNSPIQNRCQANSVIVLTDGDSQTDWDRKDFGVPINLNHENRTINGVSHSLPNWDNIPANGTLDPSPFIEHSDGICGTNLTCAGTTLYTTSRTIFLDDLAKFGNEIDLRVGGTDAAGGSWDDTEFGEEGKEGKQILRTHTIGFGFDDASIPAVLKEAAVYGDGESKSAENAEALKEALENAIAGTTDGKGTGAGATQASFSLSENGSTGIFITQYDSEQWSGDLTKVDLSEDIQSDNSIELNADFAWSAATDLQRRASDRNIFTVDPATKLVSAFSFAALKPATLALFGDIATPAGGVSEAELTINYLLGDASNEAVDHDNNPQTDPVGMFRARRYPAEDSAVAKQNPLGDMVNSRPAFVQNFNYGYIDATYGAFIEENRTRAPMIYVGANDGMLHAFEDNGNSSTETFAFIPQTTLNDLASLSSLTYDKNHHFFVDGQMTVVDAKLSSASSATGWATVLGSPIGRGFKGLFLLDISKTGGTNDELFKWEINEKTANGSTVGEKIYSKMGFMINPVKIVRFQIPNGSNAGFDEKWVMIAGNGIDSEDENDNGTIGKASVFFIDLDDGKLIKEIVLDNGHEDQNLNSPAAYESFTEGNGITSVAAVDVTSNSFIDRVYAPDLKGNIWRINYNFNQTDNPGNANDYLASKLSVAFTDSDGPAPIFTTQGPQRSTSNHNSLSGNFPQAITGEITVTRAPDEFTDKDTVMLFFGTGSYYELAHILDSHNLNVQTMYAIVDEGNRGGDTRIDKDDDLIAQGVTETGTTREFNNNTIDYSPNIGDLGWYLDLPTYGERIINKPSGFFSFISFSSQLPRNADVCLTGTDGWSMAAQRDNAAAYAGFGGGGGGGGGANVAGTKIVDQIILEPIFVESSKGVIHSPTFDLADSPDSIEVDEGTGIPKQYSRASWIKVQ